MEHTQRLHDTLVQVLSQHGKWLDQRHLKTLAWMMVGLIESGMIGLTHWAPFVRGRAVYAQSSVRRFMRWLNNERINVRDLYGDPAGLALAHPHQGVLCRLSPRPPTAQTEQLGAQARPCVFLASRAHRGERGRFQARRSSP